MLDLLVNIDVPDLEAGAAFYTEALGLERGRILGVGALELTGAAVRLYLLKKDAGSAIGPGSEARRDYARHWSPVHIDFVVDDLDAAIARVLAAGALAEGDVIDAPYGRLAMFADPFGHGLCLIEFNARGYDAIAEPG